jgi:hypothetical protein
MMLTNWQAGFAHCAGIRQIASLEKGDNNQIAARAVEIFRAMLDYRNSGLNINTLVAVHSEYAVPDVLQALAEFKPKDLSNVARQYLSESDVIVRSTAAELLGRNRAKQTRAPWLGALPTGDARR